MRAPNKLIFVQYSESSSGLSSFRLSYRLEAPVTSLNGQNGDNFNIQEPTVPTVPIQPEPVSDVPRPISRPINSANQQVNQFQDDNAVCGVPVSGFTQSLVIGGQAAGRGEW